jgi:hypothetical protein
MYEQQYKSPTPESNTIHYGCTSLAPGRDVVPAPMAMATDNSARATPRDTAQSFPISAFTPPTLRTPLARRRAAPRDVVAISRRLPRPPIAAVDSDCTRRCSEDDQF